ncbi:hypothetical protein B5M42_012280 [Paenibacillus athensensis]|uniref:Butirosin biosynthesis protein H N-terminal domain-containing protein n=1 Tax=Paenibacillus athensensis TaxID=1967502 RepID=A0A4Y8Q575_9BACL|nr:hypothetical protein [Paenibacillus athensensis]MCD1259609.1 hypothetical protein [Paenibacillus athensensis]
MSKETLKPAFNCVLASVYNTLADVHGLRFAPEAVFMAPNYFELGHFDGKLVGLHPEGAARQFLTRIGTDMAFPAMDGREGAVAFAKRFVREQGVLPAAINLRYSVLDPTNFDNDYWNFQLIVDWAEDRFVMYDQYHGELYKVEDSYLGQMIDTAFNYRQQGRFTPFLVIPVADPQEAQAALDRDHLPALALAAIRAYDPQISLRVGRAFAARMQELYLEPAPGMNLHDEIYKIMGHQILITKSRQQFAEWAGQAGLKPDALEALQSLVARWDLVNMMVPMTVGRRSAAEYERLLEEYEKLISLEATVLEQVGAELEIRLAEQAQQHSEPQPAPHGR